MSDMSPVEVIYFAALEKLPAERAAYLDEACAGNASLRERVERMLAAQPRMGQFLEPPRAAGPQTEAYVEGEAPGTIIAGKYKLLQKIGEGGMGSVWMADQTEPVKRRVAVKLIRTEREGSRTILSRFEAERQAIALMDHPRIAKLLDAGTTDGEPSRVSDRVEPADATRPLTRHGSPYFVMELVKGVPLNEFCDTHKLSVPERLHLFMQICSAVQHAHQKGIIHRDLKPSNVLVESHDGKPVPKVIDFGLAKAMSGQPLTENTLFTALGTVAGTPLYMAPEQAAFNAIDVDTRADIYALGVILYELLTGTTPIERDTFKKAAFDEILRVIRENEPPTPSKRLSALSKVGRPSRPSEADGRAGSPSHQTSSLASVSANRQTEPVKLGRFVRGELDWIVMKALAKERDRRYETANGFAKDIERFLNHEPVLAGPPSAGYRLRKFVRRNRPQVIAGSLVLLALLVGMAGTALGLIEARRQEGFARAEAKAKDDALQAEAEERKKAEAKEAEANAVVKFFEEQVFAAARPKGQEGGLGAAVSLRDAIAASEPALDKGFAKQPLVEARLRIALGNTFHYLAEHDQARIQFERARALYTQNRGPDHPDTLGSMHNLADSYAELNRPTEALKLNEEVLAIRKRVLPPDHPDTLKSMHNLAISYAELNRPTEALKLFEEILVIRKRVLPPDHPDTLKSMANLAISYALLNRPTEALKLFEEILAIQKRVLPPDHPDTLASMTNLAGSYADLNRQSEALRLREEVLAIQKRVLPKDHPETLRSMTNLASSYADLNRQAEALKLREEVLSIRKRVLPKDHPDTLASMNDLANSYSDLNRPTEALKLREEVLAIQKRVLPPDHPDTLKSMHNLAVSYADLNRHAEALKLFEAVLAIRKRVLPPDHPDTLGSMVALADLLSKADRGAEALPLVKEVLAKANRPGVDPQLVPYTIGLRLQCYQKANDPAGCRTTAEIWEKLNRPDAGSLYNAACYRAVTAGVQTKTPGADAARLAKEDADKAMAWLTKAVAAGYKDAAHMKKDTDLDSLRERDDFKKLLAELEAARAKPPEKQP